MEVVYVSENFKNKHYEQFSSTPYLSLALGPFPISCFTKNSSHSSLPSTYSLSLLRLFYSIITKVQIAWKHFFCQLSVTFQSLLMVLLFLMSQSKDHLICDEWKSRHQYIFSYYLLFPNWVFSAEKEVGLMGSSSKISASKLGWGSTEAESNTRYPSHTACMPPIFPNGRAPILW